MMVFHAKMWRKNNEEKCRGQSFFFLVYFAAIFLEMDPLIITVKAIL